MNIKSLEIYSYNRHLVFYYELLYSFTLYSISRNHVVLLAPAFTNSSSSIEEHSLWLLLLWQFIVAFFSASSSSLDFFLTFFIFHAVSPSVLLWSVFLISGDRQIIHSIFRASMNTQQHLMLKFRRYSQFNILISKCGRQKGWFGQEEQKRIRRSRSRSITKSQIHTQGNR